MKIKNWKKFQHFKDRRPPWIKLHREILDQRDINMISDCSFRVLIGIWLLASEDEQLEGNLPTVDDISFRLRMDKAKIIKALDELGPSFIHDDIKVISGQCQTVIPETETETETEAEAEPENLKVSMGDWFELNQTNRDWINDSGIPDVMKAEIFRDFVDYWKLDGGKKTKNGWQMAFRKNPIVKRKLTNFKHNGAGYGAHQKDTRSRASRVTDKLKQIAAEDILQNGLAEKLD